MNVEHSPTMMKKPSRDERAKCLNCNYSIPIYQARVWDPHLQKGVLSGYRYSGITYFCSRNCAIYYATEQARKACNHDVFNKIN